MKNVSFRAAINAKCKDCIYDSAAAGTWRQQVQVCTVKSCALYPLRPVSKNSDEEILEIIKRSFK